MAVALKEEVEAHLCLHKIGPLNQGTALAMDQWARLMDCTLAVVHYKFFLKVLRKLQSDFMTLRSQSDGSDYLTPHPTKPHPSDPDLKILRSDLDRSRYGLAQSWGTYFSRCCKIRKKCEAELSTDNERFKGYLARSSEPTAVSEVSAATPSVVKLCRLLEVQTQI